MPSIFTRIATGEIPCHMLFQNEHVIAFLDIAPLSMGHALVVPREEKAFVHELSPGAAAALGAALPVVARAILGATGARAYNILANNGVAAHQAVPHVHFHIIPKYEDLRGLSFTWQPGKVEPTEAAALAAKVRGLIA